MKYIPLTSIHNSIADQNPPSPYSRRLVSAARTSRKAARSSCMSYSRSASRSCSHHERSMRTPHSVVMPASCSKAVVYGTKLGVQECRKRTKLSCTAVDVGLEVLEAIVLLDAILAGKGLAWWDRMRSWKGSTAAISDR